MEHDPYLSRRPRSLRVDPFPLRVCIVGRIVQSRDRVSNLLRDSMR